MFTGPELDFLATMRHNSLSAGRPIWAQRRIWWRTYADIWFATTTRTPATKSGGMATVR